jgi:hypothetical protein
VELRTRQLPAPWLHRRRERRGPTGPARTRHQRRQRRQAHRARDGIWRPDALDFDRAFHFFDEERIRDARAAWKLLVGRDDVEPRYWKQNDAGRWERAS